MKKIILSFLLSTLFFNNGNAVSLYQALNETYKNNTQLNAERENINAAEEDINISKACLLYTSPSPRDKRQSRMPSSA